jgi:HEAT repeat protein
MVANILAYLQIEEAVGLRDPLTILALIGSVSAVIVTLTTSIALLVVARSNSRLKQEVEAERVRREEERMRREREIEAARQKAQEAQRIRDLADQYRRLLSSDKFISQLKILTMTRSLDLVNVYVQLVLHHQTRPDFINEDLLKAESLRDPNLLLRASQLQLEKRANAAMPPDEAIRVYKRCVIVGDPGAGKTTLLKYLALKSASRQLSGLSDVPIHIDLNVFANSEVLASPGEPDPRLLLDFAAQEWYERYKFPAKDAYEYMHANLQTGNAILLLDGLDETLIGTKMKAAEQSYNRIIHLILNTANQYPQAYIVVTSRIAGYQQHLPIPGFTELEILDFRLRDIEQFVNNWFSNDPEKPEPRLALGLNKELEQNLRIQSLASNPLLLAIVAIVYKDNEELPDCRADFYKECMEILLIKWNKDSGRRRKRNLPYILKKEDKQRLLSEIAWHFHQKGQRFFTRDEILSVIREHLEKRCHQSVEKAEIILEEIAEQTGLLKEYAYERYGFLHLTLQEYFASQQMIYNKENDFSTFIAHIEDSWWEEVLLLYVSKIDIEEQKRLIRTLMEHENHTTTSYNALFHERLLLVGRCLAATNRIEELWNPISDCLFELLLTSPYSLTRHQASDALAELGVYDEKINKQLIDIIGDDQLDICVRISVIDAFSSLYSSFLVEQLAMYLANDLLHPEIRMHIALVLGKSAARFVADQLIMLLERDWLDDDIRVCIAMALGESGETSLTSRLVPLLMNKHIERGVKVRCSIVDAIGALRDTSAVPALRQLLSLKDELGFAIYWHLIIALASLGQIEHTFQLLPILYDDKGYAVWTRREIVEALGSLRLLSLVPDLLPLLTTNEIDWQVRVSIAIAISATGDRTIIPQLCEYLGDEWIDPNVRASIAAILASLCDKQHIPVLRRVYVDKDIYPQVYRSIFITRCKLGDDKTIRHLLKWLTDNTTELAERLAILDALAALQNNSVALQNNLVVPNLLVLLRNSQVPKAVRQSITLVLVPLANESAIIEKVKEELKTLLLTRNDIADDIYQALWMVHRRRSGTWAGKK